MTTPQLNPEQKKKVSNALYFGWMAFYLISVDSAFSDLYLVAIRGANGSMKAYPASGPMNMARMLIALFMFALISYWYNPIRKFVKTFDPELKPEIRAKISNIYRDMLVFFALAAGARLLVYAVYPGISWGTFLKDLLPAMLLVLAAQMGISLASIDSVLTWVDELVGLLYERDELYRLRKGATISLFAKISLIVIVCAMIPLVMIYAASVRGVNLADFSHILGSLQIICIVTLVVGLSFVLKGVQRPLENIIGKMERISKGDYDVKSRIYFSDEVGRLKAGFNQMVDGLREREELRDTFGKYMSIEVARELLRNKRINLGGEEVDAAVMFCDIRNFTPLSGTMTPAQVVDFLNVYFSYITPPITDNNGVISKFIGDGVMAVYTPLLGSENYAADAVRSALEMRKALAALNASGKSPIQVRFGIGIQTGKLIAGNIGTLSRLEYTFIGDTVNVASRLESKTKEVGTDILVSKGVVEKAAGSLGSGARFESIGMAALKGKAEPLELYKVL